MEAMVRIAFLLVLASSALAATGDAIDPVMGKPVSELTEEDKAIRRQRIMEFQGGMIEVEPQGPRFCILDCRKNDDDIPEKVASDFLGKFKIGVMAVREKPEAGDILALIEVTDGSEETPVLAIYPEERRATVNSGSILRQGAAEYARRLERELWRAICFVGGAGYSPSSNSLVQPIFTLEELDAINSKGVNMVTISQLAPLFAKCGVRKGSKISYRNAVRQGWAPAPTNDIQRAVWEDEQRRKAVRGDEAPPASPDK